MGSSIQESVARSDGFKVVFTVSAVACSLVVSGIVIAFIRKVLVTEKPIFMGVKSKPASHRYDKSSYELTQLSMHD